MHLRTVGEYIRTVVNDIPPGRGGVGNRVEVLCPRRLGGENESLVYCRTAPADHLNSGDQNDIRLLNPTPVRCMRIAYGRWFGYHLGRHSVRCIVIVVYTAVRYIARLIVFRPRDRLCYSIRKRKIIERPTHRSGTSS